MTKIVRNLVRSFLPLWALGVCFFLYTPIAILILFSFNDSPLAFTWGGFTTRWYSELFEMPDVWIALKNSLIVACSCVLLSLTMAVFYVCWGGSDRLHKFNPLFYAGVALPEIVVAVSLLSFFSFFSVPLGFATLIAGHTLLGLGFAVPIIRTQLLGLDYRLMEASSDLGASSVQTFFKITVPLLMPALISSGLLIFILSFDDFLISFFCAGTTAQTLSLYIFSMIRLGVSPAINALSSLLLAASSLLVLVFCAVRVRE